MALQKIAIRKGEKLSVNGATIRAHWAVNLEILNDAHFVSGPMVMEQADASSALDALYLFIQSNLMNPITPADERARFGLMLAASQAATPSDYMQAMHREVEQNVAHGLLSAALRVLWPHTSLPQNAHRNC
ncbi:MAG: Flagellar basalbody rod modification protein FlgD [Hyphomicrobiales bacterium]|nr:Flagellar basalbody rod modification protein FlgD [Hyphomicrobiales bacterium]